MAMIDKLPQAFWTQASLNYKKFKKGALPLDECYEAQRKLYISHVDKLEKDQSNVEAQKKIKMDKAKKIEKVMERLQRQSLLSQKQNPKTGQDTAEVKQSAGKDTDEAPADSQQFPARQHSGPRSVLLIKCFLISLALSLFSSRNLSNVAAPDPDLCGGCQQKFKGKRGLTSHQARAANKACRDQRGGK